MAAGWVAERWSAIPSAVTPATEPVTEPIGNPAAASVGYGRDATMASWSAADVAWFVGRRNPATVGTQALAYLVAHPKKRQKGEDIAAAIMLKATDDAKAREMISGAFGWIGRDCSDRHLPLPFMFDDATGEYWVTEEQAKALGAAGL